MAKIWKFVDDTSAGVIGKSNDFSIKMPNGAEIIKIDLVGDRITIWALLHRIDLWTKRNFTILRTGEEFDNNDTQLTYLTTLQIGGKSAHIFEIYTG